MGWRHPGRRGRKTRASRGAHQGHTNGRALPGAAPATLALLPAPRGLELSRLVDLSGLDARKPALGGPSEISGRAKPSSGSLLVFVRGLSVPLCCSTHVTTMVNMCALDGCRSASFQQGRRDRVSRPRRNPTHKFACLRVLWRTQAYLRVSHRATRPNLRLKKMLDGLFAARHN